MADDKKIKYLMHYRRNKSLETQTGYSNTIKKRNKNLKANEFLNKNTNFYNDVTIIVHRKKICRLSTNDSMHIVDTLKRNSTPICYISTSRTQISSKLSVSLQRLPFHNQNNRKMRSSQNHSPHYAFAKWDIYRCQFSTQEESCCCSCNSDAMFEVMKSLYDCYKKKNCDNCNCILCGHLPREERRLGELRKTGVDELGIKEKKKAKRKIKSKELLAIKQAKTPEEKEAALKKLILSGVALPEPKTASEKDLIEKVKTQLALPPQPRSKSEKELYKKAEAQGLITPLEGKTKSQKLKILEKQRDLGLTLPEGRTVSEKALIEKIKSAGVASVATEVPSEKLRKAKKEGLLTPLEGKTPEQKKKILRGLALNGIPLPKGKSNSERNLIDQVRDELGLPPPPKTLSDKKNYKKALKAGIITPLEGKTSQQKEDILRKQAEMGLPLPRGRTPSEKALIAKIQKTTKPLSEFRVPSEKMRKAKAEGLLTPLKGKTKAQKEKILRGLAQNGIPLPEGKTESEKNLIDKVRADVGLPPEPKTSAERTKYNKALAAGIITPLEGKTPQQKEDILRKQAEMGIPLTQGRTASEKALVAKIQKTIRPLSEYRVPSEKMRKAKAEGLLTPLKGKTAEQKENILRGLAQNGIPLPEAKTESERKIIDKVRADLGLPPEPKTSAEKGAYKKALAAGIITPLEGKTPQQKEDILRKQAEMGIPLTQGRTASEKALVAKIQQTTRPLSEYRVPSEKMRKAKAEGLLTPLKGKTAEQKENILRGLARNGIPLPEGKTKSEKKIIDKVRADLGLPPEPRTSAEKGAYKKALAAGIITPLEGKTPQQKEEILRKQAEMGIPLTQGRTASEKALVAKIQKTVRPLSEYRVPSEKMRKAKAEGLLTPLKGKTAEQKENILRGLARNGIPLPEGKTKSEKKIIDKVRADLGLPPEPRTSAEKGAYKKALAAGIITPLEGKTPQQKEEILRKQAEMGIPLTQGRTASEKALVAKIQKTVRPLSEYRVPSEKMRKAKAEGLLTPLKGKTAEQKENILRGLAQNGIPLPEGETKSERKIIDKVRADLGLPPEPRTSAEKGAYKKALAAGIITPLEGKTPQQKEEILRKQAEMGIPLTQGRTASEKALVAKIQKTVRPLSEYRVPSEKMRKAKAEGLLTPLKGKTAEQKENILRGLAQNGIPLPEGETKSERKIIDKVRADLGLPPEPRTSAEKGAYKKALAAGIITPLEGKTPQQKEDILRKQAEMGVPLPQGRTPSEKAMIANIRHTVKPHPEFEEPFPSGNVAEKERALKSLAIQGKKLPAAKTPSEEKILNKVRRDLGLPPEPKSQAERDTYNQAIAAGVIEPLEGKTKPQKEKILQAQADMGIPLPEGRTASEKALIKEIKSGKRKRAKLLPPAELKKLETKTAKKMKEGKGPSDECICDILTPESEKIAIKSRVPSEKIRKAKEAGLLTPLEGKSAKDKERILKSLAKEGLPLPKAKSPSEKKLIDKVKAELGIPVTAISSEKLQKAYAAGLLTPLEGKTTKEKEKILKSLAKEGLPLPEPRTASEKKLIEKVKTEMGMPPAVPSEKLRRAKEAGLLTPLKGKTTKEKEKILKGLLKEGLPLPEANTASEKKLIAKMKKDLGIPVGGIQSEKLRKAKAAGLITPLEGKPKAQKEKILRGRVAAGLPLPEGVSASDKELIKKIKAETGYITPVAPKSKSLVAKIPSEKLKAAKAAGLLTPLHGKSDSQKEKILRGLALHGIPLPKGETPSEKKIIAKLRKDLGLPSEPQTPSLKEKFYQAQEMGIITPLEGKTPSQKERILRKQAEMGIPLPEGRTASEKELINKVKATTVRAIPSEKLRKAKEAGLLTPLHGKSQKEKEKILKGLAKAGLPLPEGKSTSEKQLIKRVKADMGLPLGEISSGKLRKALAEGLITPFEGKTPAQKEKLLRGRVQAGLPLPEGVSPSDKALIKKIKAETGYVTPRTEKLKRVSEVVFPKGQPAERERILKNLALQGKRLPEAKTPSEEKILTKVRRDLGLPPEPKSQAERDTYNQAIAAGVIEPLEGKTKPQKEKILQAQADMGIPLPEGRTASEKALIKEIKSGKRKRAKLLPPAELKKLETKTAKKMKEGKGPSDECICDILTPESEKLAIKSRVPSEKIRKAKEAGLLTPLEGKSAKDKERILKSLAKEGLPLPKAKSPSEKKLIDKVKAELGIPVTAISSEKLRKAYAAGLLTPLEGKTTKEKEKILKSLAKEGLPLPEPRTASEKKLIEKVKTEMGMPPAVPSEKLRRAKEAGLLTPLEGKTAKEKERILKSLAKEGLPLPEPKTASERKLIDKLKKEMGLPTTGIPSEIKRKAKAASLPLEGISLGKLRKAQAEGLITPLEGKSPAQKEKILRGRVQAGLPLPEGVSPSDKALIKKIKAETGYVTPRKEKLKRVSEVVFPKGPPAEREKILKNLALQGKRLPEAKTPSEEKILTKVRRDLGLPPEPKSQAERDTYNQAIAAGVIEPLEGKTKPQKEKILQAQADMGIPLPEGRTASEKALIKEIKSGKRKRAKLLPPAELKKLETKTAKKMKEGKGPSDECICDILTPESEKLAIKSRVPSEKIRKAKEAGLLTPLEGKSAKDKERILKSLAKEGLPLPEPKTVSEKKLIDKVKTEMGIPTVAIPSEKLRKARAAGLLTPITGKSDSEKERILTGLAQNGIPLPKAQTSSEKKIIEKVRKNLGLPPEPKTSSIRQKYDQAHEAGIITPLEGKTMAQKEDILTKQAEMGLPLPEGRTPSEKDLINRIRKTVPKKKSEIIGEVDGIPITASKREAFQKAKKEGLLTPLKGKSMADKEKIVRGLAEIGLPIPEGKTPSEKALIQKVRTSLGLPPEPTPSERQGKIKTKSKKSGFDRAKRSEVAVGVGKSKIGIREEFQDIIKTTTCDRGCGCDRKKIRFKHSYVKIRVTSPDISSLCPCPDECVPGVKGGVFTDSEGIKVTVGQVSAAPSFTSKEYIKAENTKLEIKYQNHKVKFSSISSESINIKSKNRLQHKSNYSESLSDTFIFIKSSDESDDSKLSIDISTVLGALESSFLSLSSNKSILSKSISIISITVSNCSSNSAYLIERTLDYSSQSNESVTDLDIYQEEYYRIARMHSMTCDIDLDADLRSDKMLNDHPTVLKLSTMNNIYNCECRPTHSNLASVITKILSQQPLSENSSLYVLLPTSSEDTFTRLNCNSGVSSTICIQLSEKPLSCKGCFNTHNHSEFQQSKQKKSQGLKISAKGRNKSIERHRVPGQLMPINTSALKIKGRVEICTDTTEDRPCCCDMIKEGPSQKRKMTNVISELVTPFINNDAISQGLNRDNYGCYHEIIRKKEISYRTKKLGPNQTPVRLCKIPSCGNFSEPPTQNIRNLPTSTSKQCECNFEKLKEILEKIGRDLVSKSCGSSTERIGNKINKQNEHVKPIIKNTNQKLSKSHDCISCGSLSKEEMKGQCPCEQHARKNNNLEETIPSPSYGFNANTGFNEKKKNKKKDKQHIICECPPVSNEEFDPILWIDEDQIRKMKSALTQNQSGFKITSVPKEPEPEMTFEEALSYVIQSDQEKYGKLFCLCHEKHGKNKKADCECPPEEVPEKSTEELKGFKLHIGGKGSSSKGLSGVLCFQIIED